MTSSWTHKTSMGQCTFVPVYHRQVERVSPIQYPSIRSAFPGSLVVRRSWTSWVSTLARLVLRVWQKRLASDQLSFVLWKRKQRLPVVRTRLKSALVELQVGSDGTVIGNIMNYRCDAVWRHCGVRILICLSLTAVWSGRYSNVTITW